MGIKVGYFSIGRAGASGPPRLASPPPKRRFQIEWGLVSTRSVLSEIEEFKKWVSVSVRLLI